VKKNIDHFKGKEIFLTCVISKSEGKAKKEKKKKEKKEKPHLTTKGFWLLVESQKKKGWGGSTVPARV
jgi:hypothetical protein